MPTTARILSACLLAALATGPGCGALGAEDAGTQHDGGSPNSDGGSGENCTCALTVYPEQPTVGTILSAKVDPLKGVSPFTYTWSAYGADGDPITVTPRNSELTQVDIPLESAGSYLIEVQQRTSYGYTCMAQKSLLVKNPTGKTEQVLFKFIPPASSGIPVQQQKLTITGGTPQGDLNLTLEQGILLALDVSDAVGATAPAFVRFVANDKGFETEAYLAAGASLDLNVLDDSYDVLVIPDESGTKRFAPTLSVNQALSTLTPPGSKLALDPGVVVTGSVTAGVGDGVDGARVMLTKGRLPSTVGLADATGAFSVRVQPGTGFGVSVSPPPEASGLPDLELADGVAIDAAGGQLTVAYDAAIQPVNDLAAEIRTNDSAKVIVGARVTLRGEIGTAGHVTIGATTFDAPGVVRRVATTDSSGVVTFPSLPAGDYAVVIEPLGHGLTDDATTRAIVSLPTSQVTVPLFKKVTLSGTLERPADLNNSIKDSRVKAILQLIGAAAPTLGTAPTTWVDNEAGTFGVPVDPAAATASIKYAVVADPPAGTGMARAIRVVDVGSLDVDVTPLALPRGLLLAGQVRPLYGVPLAGVYIEAHRYRAPGNEDPAARAETYTDDQGHFSLLFCDPDDME